VADSSPSIISFYYSFGDYDGLLIFEAPDETAIASALVAAVSAGRIKAIKTTTLLSAEEGSRRSRRLRRDEVSSPAPFAYATRLRFPRRPPVGSWVNNGGRVACRYTKILNRSLRTIRGRGVGPGQGGKACEAGPLL
jgi:GYD domain